MNAIEAKNVSFIYPDGTVGIQNINLHIKEGQKVALVGANGSGKTTLLMVLAGLLKPTKGTVKILGREVNGNIEFVRKNVGVAFQNPDDFLFNPTVKEELLYTPAQLDIPYEKALELAKDFSQLFGIEQLWDKPPFRLSGGEKKRVELACIMMLKPRILLLDEPTANIDGRTKRKILDFLKTFDGTLLIATHDLEIIPQLADKIVILNSKRSIETVGGLELLNNKRLLEEVGIY